MPETDAITGWQRTRKRCCTVLSTIARAIFAPIVCFIVGGVLAVAIAWTIAFTCTPFASLELFEIDVYRERPSHWRFQIVTQFGAQYVHVDPDADEVYMVPGQSVVTVGDLPAFWTITARDKSHLSRWCLTRFMTERPTFESTQPFYWREEAFGWPNVCMRQVRHVSAPAYASSVWRGYVIGDRSLPLDPLWRGLTLNTLLYAGTLWAVRLLFVALRSARRRRKGLCGACKYDLRGADHARCPECGVFCRPVNSQ